MKLRKALLSAFGVFTLVLLCHCAGPTSPFGSPEYGSDPNFSRGMATAGLPIKITFYPERQVLHGHTDFSVLIEDPWGITPDYRVRLFYNGLDVTSNFLKQATRHYVDSEHTKLRINIANLRLPPLRQNRIYFGYMRNLETRPVFARYSPPSCSIFDKKLLASTHEFEISDRMKKLLQNLADTEKINANYLAGLIAQESGFNAKAVSWAKAIGLTQITPVGEAEVIKSFQDWPRYPDINKMSLPTLKWRVSGGKINSKNEWRLNPALSVKGGLNYLRYLSEYWSKEENFKKLQLYGPDQGDALSAAILASYNSGPARVNYAMQRFGRRWLEDAPELGEARLYVTRVTSYCDYFSQAEEEELE